MRSTKINSLEVFQRISNLKLNLMQSTNADILQFMFLAAFIEQQLTAI